MEHEKRERWGNKRQTEKKKERALKKKEKKKNNHPQTKPKPQVEKKSL